MTTLHICDRCGKSLEGYRFKSWFPLEIEEVPHYIVARGRRGKMELCKSCNKDFAKVIDKWLEQKNEI